MHATEACFDKIYGTVKSLVGIENTLHWIEEKNNPKNNVTFFYDTKSYIIWEVIWYIMCTKKCKELKTKSDQ